MAATGVSPFFAFRRMQNPFEREMVPSGLRIKTCTEGMLTAATHKGTDRFQGFSSYQAQTDSRGFRPRVSNYIGCTPLLLLLWNPCLPFVFFRLFGPYFKWILLHSKESKEKKCVGAENSFCRCGDEVTHMFGSRSVTDDGVLQNCGCAYSNEMLLAEIG